MKSRLARGGAVALLVLAMAITPLSVVFSAGQFETWLPRWNANVHVTLDDQTGMARAISDASPATGPGDLGTVINPGGNRYVLQATWGDGSCVRDAHLALRRSENGYVLEHSSGSCFHLDLTDYRVAIYLWAPIDAATVALTPSRFALPR
jgi:hypothetical protein